MIGTLVTYGHTYQATFTVMNIKIVICWGDIVQSCDYQRFRVTYCLHLQSSVAAYKPGGDWFPLAHYQHRFSSLFLFICMSLQHTADTSTLKMVAVPSFRNLTPVYQTRQHVCTAERSLKLLLFFCVNGIARFAQSVICVPVKYSTS